LTALIVRAVILAAIAAAIAIPVGIFPAPGMAGPSSVLAWSCSN
jgi:hypothetical protein